MRGIIIKVLAVALPFFGGVMATLRYFTDWIGRSTVPEDFEALFQKAGVAMTWLSEQPALIFYWFPAALIVTALALAFQPEIAGLILRWSHLVGQFGGEVKVYSGC